MVHLVRFHRPRSLLLQRDAVEDAYLLRLARSKLGANRTSAFIRKLVRSPTEHTDDALLLEKTRREVAAALVEQVALQQPQAS